MIAFNCEKCGAGLKVKDGVAGHTVLCPKCGKKTQVPRGSDAEDGAPAGVRAEGPAAEPGPAAPTRPAEQPTPKPPVEPASAASALRDDAEAQRREAEVRDLTERVRSMQEERDAARDAAREAAAKADAAKSAAGEAGRARETEIEKTAVGRYEADLAAKEQRIAELEKQLSERPMRAPAVVPVPLPRRAPRAGVAASGASEAVNPDALIADISKSCFGKHLRTAILIHVVIIVLTSVAYLMRVVTRKDADAEVPAPVETAAAVAPVEMPAVEETGEVAETESKPQAPPREKTDLEKNIESVPEAGALPGETSISLDDDL